ncbi:hypothetical protein [Actinosynnema sp. NPDC023587]|uniref:hypothetical protein n=1 Tax=Actinosynnema sp. NPDC023587 TaxID=3154695 RepID=UPI0033DFB4BA
MSPESEVTLYQAAGEPRSKRLPMWARLAGTVGVLGFDVLLVWLLHIGGAALSQLVEVFSGEVGHNRLTAVLREHGIGGLRPEYFGGPLPLDIPTAVYLGLCAVVATGFVVTDRGDRVSTAWNVGGMSVVWLPAVLYPLVSIGWIILGIAAAVMTFLAGLFTGDHDLWTISEMPFPLTWGPFLIFVSYAYGCATMFGIAVQASLRDLWKSRPVTR